jgi:hypothetical protein
MREPGRLFWALYVLACLLGLIGLIGLIVEVTR